MSQTMRRPAKLWGIVLVMSLLSLGVTAVVRSPDQSVAGKATATLPVISKPASKSGAATIPDTSRLPSQSALNVSPAKTAGPAVPQAGEQIKWWVVGVGGGETNSANFRLTGTVGQTATGPAASTSNKVNQGFGRSFLVEAADVVYC